MESCRIHIENLVGTCARIKLMYNEAVSLMDELSELDFGHLEGVLNRCIKTVILWLLSATAAWEATMQN